MEEFGGPYPRPFTRDFDAWSRAVTPARIDELRRDGFTVVDDFLGGGGADGDDDDGDAGSSPSPSNNGDAWALALREEIVYRCIPLPEIGVSAFKRVPLDGRQRVPNTHPGLARRLAAHRCEQRPRAHAGCRLVQAVAVVVAAQPELKVG